MKNIFVLAIVLTFQATASVYSQNTKITLDIQGISLNDVISRIEKETQYVFFYRHGAIDNARRVSVHTKDGNIYDVLQEMFKDSGIDYVVKDRLIILGQKEMEDTRAFRQGITVTGTVLDEKGVTLPGVNVTVKGTLIGVVSNADGKFSINVPDRDAVLSFSFLGYSTIDVQVGDQTAITVTLGEESQEIEEVVVVGYGTQRKRDLTGAVASVNSAKLKERSYSNVMQSLAGQLPGIQISQSQGAPGFAPSIKIRGASTINAGATPLYVIDGIPLEDYSPTETTSQSPNQATNLTANANPLNMINPQDIESVEILKDASSAAIYGSRGANGVVLITTKQGRAGATRVDVNYEFGVSSVARRYEMMNAQEFIEFTIAGRNNTWVSNDPVNNKATDPNSLRPATNLKIPEAFTDPTWLARIGNGTDWQDVLFRTAYSHNVQASVSGGSEKTQFMISAGYLNSEGTVDGTYYNRLTARANLRHKISERFTSGVNMSYARMGESSFGTEGKSDVVSLAIQSDPIFPVVNERGTYGFLDPQSIWNPAFTGYNLNLWHPWAQTREIKRRKETDNMMGVGFVEVKLFDGLSFKTSLNASVNAIKYDDFRNKGQNYGWSVYQDAAASFRTAHMFNWAWENTLNYNKVFGNHAVTGLLGYTAQEQKIYQSSLTSQSFPNDMVHTLNAGTPTAGQTSASEWALLSYLARVTYSWQGKYLASAAIRADGSSRFGANNPWGYFPSASAAWRLSQESFMENLTWLDNLKLRVSYGVTGNNQISDYGAIGLLTSADYVFDGTVYPGLYTNTYPDKDLRWEKTKQINFGLDISLWNNRLNATLDYYHSKTEDMLLNVPVPVLSGFTTRLTNIGQLQNNGLELNISSRNVTSSNFEWTTDFNISGNRNKVLKLGINDAPVEIANSSTICKTEVGQPISNYYGYMYDGVIMSAADLTNYPHLQKAGYEPGDPIIRDVDGNGTLTPDDRTTIGNYQPDFIWGMTNTFNYRGLELVVMLQGVQGNEIFNQQGRFTKEYNDSRNAYKSVFNYWRSEAEPGDGKTPKPRVTPGKTVKAQSCSYWVEDGSFVRIRNVRLGYTLPRNLTQKLSIASAKLYVNVENLYVFSDYPNFDPEGSTFQTGAMVGLDYGTYPSPRTWTIGINIGF
ncbi:MAG: TonB-dependent receptor [Bacteroidales bacterium]|nr:TonB-dependent receptor [Bacteroidales bacterium]